MVFKGKMVGTMLALCLGAVLPCVAAAQPPVEKPAEAAKPEAKAPAAPSSAPAPAAAAQPDKVVQVKMSTSLGDIVLELNETKAPISTANFLSYVDKGHYDGTIFHRVINGFMIQGGGVAADGKEKPTDAPIKNEWQNGLKNTRGTIAMARTAIPDSATSQFFINVNDNPFLDKPNGGAAYAVFGRVVSGMDVVDKIKAVRTAKMAPGSEPKPTLPTGMRADQPVEPVSITAVVRVAAK